MLDPSAADIGRRVVYRDSAGRTDEGIITSFNLNYVFVRYGRNGTSYATDRRNLDWYVDSTENRNSAMPDSSDAQQLSEQLGALIEKAKTNLDIEEIITELRTLIDQLEDEQYSAGQ